MSNAHPRKKAFFHWGEYIYKYIINFAPLLLCMGLVLSLIQKTVRFAYYEVDHLYLMEIRTEEVLQGLSYLFIFIYSLFLSHDIYVAYVKYKILHIKTCITNIVFIVVYILFLWYTQTYYINISQIIVIAVFALFVVTTMIAIQASYKGKIDIPSIKSTGCAIIFITIFAVAALQYLAEMSNKRFTYIQNNKNEYIIITTFKDYYITVLSKVDNNTITIYRGMVYIFKLDQDIIAHEFKEKIML